MADTSTSSKWMTNMWDTIKDKTLGQVVMPGTHDSGMAVISDASTAAGANNTKTQHLTIAQQLLHGSRYFDLRPAVVRPVPKNPTYYLGHFGARGGSIGEVLVNALDSINKFAEENPREIIVLYFSHCYVVDSLNNTYLNSNNTQMSDSMKRNLINLIYSKLKTIFKYAGTYNNDINSIPLKGFERRNVVCIFEQFEDTASGVYQTKMGITTHIGQSTLLTPAIATDQQKNIIYVVFSCSRTHKLLFTHSTDGGKHWEAQKSMGTSGNTMETYTTPSMVVCFGRIYVVFKEEQYMYTTYSNDNGETWAKKIRIGETSNAPALAVAPNGLGLQKPIFFVLYARSDKQLCTLSSLDGEHYSDNSVLPDCTTPMPPAFTCDTVMNTFSAIFVGVSSSQLYCITGSLQSDGKIAWRQVGKVMGQGTGQKSNSPPAVVAWNGTLTVLYKHEEKRFLVYLNSINGGTSWTPPSVLEGDFTKHGPAIALGTHSCPVALFVETGDDGKIYFTTSGSQLMWEYDGSRVKECDSPSSPVALASFGRPNKTPILFALQNKSGSLVLNQSDDNGANWRLANFLSSMTSKCQPVLATSSKYIYAIRFYLPDYLSLERLCYETNRQDSKLLYRPNGYVKNLVLAVSQDDKLFLKFRDESGLHSATGEGFFNWKINTINEYEPKDNLTTSMVVDSHNVLYELSVHSYDVNRGFHLRLNTSKDDGNTWECKDVLSNENPIASIYRPTLILNSSGVLNVVVSDKSGYLTTYSKVSDWIEIAKSSAMTHSFTTIQTAQDTYTLSATALPYDAIGIVYTTNDKSVHYYGSMFMGASWHRKDVHTLNNNHFRMFDSYAESKDADYVINNQKEKLKKFPEGSNDLFVLNWTCTMDTRSTLTPHFGWKLLDDFFLTSVKDLAESINPSLQNCMDEWKKEKVITHKRKPNVVLMDFYDNSYLNTIISLNSF